MKTDKEIVNEANALARKIYKAMGCEVPDDFKFYEATHPQEEGCWNTAVIAYDHIEGTDVEEALYSLDD